VCITDDSSGIRSEVVIRPMPPFDLPETFRFRGFRRMFLFQKELADLSGVLLHFDLDLLITGSIDDFFDHQPEQDYVVAENWTQPGQGIGNMSVFRFRVGSLTKIWDRFHADPLGMLDLYRNSQTFVSRTLDKVAFFPLEWCLGFKQSLIPAWPLNFLLTPRPPPRASRVVAFTGKPDMDEAARGEWPVTAAWRKIYKYVRPTPWINEIWK
jgi:hypothetical protein